MINTVSQAFKAKLVNGEIPKIRMQFVPASGEAFWLSDGDFWADGTSFTEATSVNGEFSVGAAIIGAFNFTLNNFEGNLTDEVFRGALVIPLLYFEIDGENEYLAKGIYYIATHRTAGNLIRCTAYDGMKLLDEHRTAITYPITVQNLITTICTANSITLATPTIPNGSYTIPTAPENQLTDRQMLSYACQITGNFAKMDENGQMVVGWYDTTSPVVIENTFEGKDLWTNSITITGVKGVVNDSSGENVVERTATYGTTDCMVVIRDNPYMTPTNLQAVVNMVGQRICGITFRPGSLPILSNPCIQAGDVLIVTDNITGNSYHLLATEIIYNKQIIETVICNFNADEEADIRPTIESITNTTIEQAKQQAAQAASAASAAIASASQAAIAAQTADAKAEAASTSASQAYSAARTAESEARDAIQAAATADQKATEAQRSATAAQTSANNANEYASRALNGLYTVQSVAETLAWITQHGTMTLTTDTVLDPTHVYFVQDNNGDYVVGNTHYSIVAEPSAADLSTYYVLSIDESLNNYVATHLALTAEGLWIIPDSSGYKILIATGSGSAYTEAGTYIINSSGGVVARFGQTAQIGENTKTRAKFDYHSLELIDNEGSPYFHISDLRNANGIAEDVTERFRGDGTHKVFTLFGGDGVESTPTITINGTPTTAWTIDNTGTITFTNAPPGDSEIIVTYDYNGQLAKTFTIGTRSGNIGLYTYAEGYGAESSGIASHAEGKSVSSGYMSHAEGEGTASGDYSHAEGLGVASGAYCHAEGAGEASGGYTHAEGNSTAEAGYSHAEGYHTRTTTAGHNHSEGSYTVAMGRGAHAEGEHSQAIGTYAHAGGLYTIAQRKSQMTIGEYNEADSTGTSTGARGTYAFIIGNGTAEDARSNAFAVTWDGDSHIPATGDLYDGLFYLGWISEVTA